MASYEIDHNISSTQSQPPPRRRPDLSTFLSSYNHIDTANTSNTHAEPTPADVAAVTRNLAEWYEALRNDNGSNDTIQTMLQQLWTEYDTTPSKGKGVSDEFLAGLDRVNVKKLKKDDSCAICSNPFLEDPYPLVVELPCHKDHRFDLECISPWLKMHNTCPLDRKELEKPKAPPPPKADDEEDYDDMYG